MVKLQRKIDLIWFDRNVSQLKQCVDFNFCLKDKHSTELSKQSSLKISFKKVLVRSDRSSFCFISVRDKNVLQDQRDSLLIFQSCLKFEWPAIYGIMHCIDGVE